MRQSRTTAERAPPRGVRLRGVALARLLRAPRCAATACAALGRLLRAPPLLAYCVRLAGGYYAAIPLSLPRPRARHTRSLATLGALGAALMCVCAAGGVPSPRRLRSRIRRCRRPMLLPAQFGGVSPALGGVPPLRQFCPPHIPNAHTTPYTSALHKKTPSFERWCFFTIRAVC